MARRRMPQRTTSSPVAGTAGLQTVGDWLRFTVTCFTRQPLAFAQGLHGPQEEAMFLIARFLGLEPEDLPHFVGARLTRAEINEVRTLIRQRVERHVPVPYLVQEAALGGLRFFVDRRVLIPRSYIAALLAQSIPLFAGKGWRPRRILDLGTGCGCLAILAARAFPDAIVDAVDISDDALAVAAHNVAAHHLEHRVHLIQSDLFAAVPPVRYDLVLANPPYEPTDRVDHAPAELRHEPRLALDGGVDGMDCVRRILTAARAHLSPAGVLVLEHGGLRDRVHTEFPRLKFHVFPLPDETDAVIGVRAKDLPQPEAALRPRRRRGAQPGGRNDRQSPLIR